MFRCGWKINNDLAVLKDGRRVVVRPLELGDGEALAAFYESVPREDYRFYRPHRLDRQRAMENAANAGSLLEVVLVAQAAADGRIAGYAWYRWKEADARSGFGICIRREFQSCGLGGTLMERLMEIARHVGPPVMCLTVQVANERAVALYRKMGFEVVAQQMLAAKDGFAAEPEYRMERRCR